MSNVKSLPGRVNINLDEVENEEAKEPFVAVLAGREIVFSDPERLERLEHPDDRVLTGRY